jgi:hypothetical protein
MLLAVFDTKGIPGNRRERIGAEIPVSKGAR